MLLAERGLKPLKRFGQNFLHDHNQLRKLVDAADLSPGDLVLEVGPGTGTLTEALLEKEARVIAAEIDEGLADLMRDRFGDRIQLIRGDCLATGRRLSDPIREAIGDSSWRLVANLPYQAASPLMIELLLNHPHCQGQYVTIQREVAERLNASPGDRQRGPLGILATTFGEVDRIGDIPGSCFWPAPKVTSSMVSIRPRSSRPDLDGNAFARFISLLFAKRRKQLGSIFGRSTVLPDGIDPIWRAEVLTDQQLMMLFQTVAFE
tara:strand:+ start:6891 stop:7679 length:789 start_codon:yes stop_codon:yes gene_type:complete